MMFETGARSAIITQLIFILLAFLGGCAQVPVRHQVGRGIHLEKIVTDTGEIVHVATVDLKYAELALVEAKSLQPVSKFALDNHAAVAVNAGFFTKEGLPVGALKIHGTWKSFPTKNRGVFGWNAHNGLFFDRLEKSDVFNEKIKSEFSSKSWWKEADNIIGGAPLMILDKKVLDVVPEKTLSSFLENKYARTAICVDDLGRVKLLVVDGGDRRSAIFGQIQGMSIKELAQFMVSLGCVHALNLDGGYSSTFIHNGQRINQFSAAFMGERPVANAIIVRERL